MVLYSVVMACAISRDGSVVVVVDSTVVVVDSEGGEARVDFGWYWILWIWWILWIGLGRVRFRVDFDLVSVIMVVGEMMESVVHAEKSL